VADGKRRARLVAAALSLSCLSREAVASPLFETAGGVTGTGGANARVAGPSSASAYFNPALLPYAKQSFELGVLVLSQQVGMTLDARTGGNVPLSVGDRQIVDGSGSPISNQTVPSAWLERGCAPSQCGEPTFSARPRQGAGSGIDTRSYTVVGLVSHVLGNYAVLGVHAFVPNAEFTTARSFYNDERSQFFTDSLHPELYSDRLTSTSLAFGVGSRILDNLSLGMSFTLNLQNAAVADTYVRDPVDYDKLLLKTDVAVESPVSPHFGLNYRPLDWLDVSATVHTQQEFIIDTEIRGTLPSGNQSSTTRRAVHSFLPWTFAVGGNVKVMENVHEASSLSFVGTLQYALWSDYKDRHGESPGADGSQYAWSDVFGGAVGARYEHGRLRTLLDLSYYPTPTPEQTGRRNYVDNDRWGATLGGDYAVDVLGLQLRPGLRLQAQRLPYRHHTKDDSKIVDELPDDAVDARTGAAVPGAAGLQTNNPGWPGFASEGWILGGAVTVALIY
jgi:hypothetical protein